MSSGTRVNESVSSRPKPRVQSVRPTDVPDMQLHAEPRDKTVLIDAITTLNPTASPDWLQSFDAHALEEYLAHLEYAREPRGGQSVWRRPERRTRAA